MTKCKTCKKTASYGYKKDCKRIACKDCKKDDMISVSGRVCADPPCPNRASFGYSKDDDKLYCGKHKDINMINVLNKMCIVCHKVQPCYNYEGEKRGLYCVTDKLEGMVDVTKKTCLKCDIIPCFGYEDGKKQYCATHKLKDMIDLTKNTCLECDVKANWNYIGETQGIYCSNHKKDGMVDLQNKKCIYPACPKSASYGLEDGTKEYCATHKSDDMVLISGKHCVNCNRNPSFGEEGGLKTHCSLHKLSNHVDLAHRKCEFKDCKENARFNTKGEELPKYCKKHSNKDMIDVTKKCCDDCNTTAGFGIPGHPPTKCAQHKTVGMISEPRKRCITKLCNEIALYGLNKQQHCEKHKEPNEYNLVEKDCKLCNLPMILNDQGLCGFCDPTMVKSFKLAKQKEIKTLLDNKGYKYKLYDRIIDSQCTLQRPDFMFECAGYCVVLECDENAHSNYGSKCERNRMINISQALGIKTIFIRYNPDKFKSDKITKELTKMQRQIKLLKVLDEMLKKDHEKLEFLSVVYLFYDNYDPNNITLETIDIFDN